MAACSAAAAHAQALSTEITVESSVETELPPASPLPSVFPSLLQRHATDIRLRPAQYSEAVDYTTTAGSAAPALFAGTQAPDRHRGYVWAGYFPAYNLSAGSGYKIIDTEASLAGVAVSGNGYSYTPGDAKVQNNTFDAQAYGSHRFEQGATVSGKAAYMFSDIVSPVYFGTHKINAFDADVKVSGEGAVDYSASIGYSRFGYDNRDELAPGMIWNDEFSPSDDIFAVKGVASHRFGNERRQRMLLGLDFELLHRHGIRTGEGIFSAEPYGNSTTGLVKINPAYEISSAKAILRVGATVDLGINPDNKSFHIAPDVLLAWMPRKEFTVYATFGGGERFRTLRDLYAYSPFATGYCASSRSFTPVDAKVGITAHPFSGFSAGVSAGYSSTRRMPMPLVQYFLSPTFAPIDLSGWHLGAEASYDAGKYFKGSLKARFYEQGYCKGNADNIDRARAVFGVELESHPVEKLIVTAGYQLRACRAYYESVYSVYDTATPEIIHIKHSLGNISDLSLGGSYRITDTFAAFARIENLLCRRTLILPGVESRRLHGLAGVSLFF